MNYIVDNIPSKTMALNLVNVIHGMELACRTINGPAWINSSL